MELAIWQIVVLVFGTFDVAFILGALWGNREKEEMFVNELPRSKPTPHQHTVKYMLDGNYGFGIRK